MSLSLYDDNQDWIGQAASGAGWHDVISALGQEKSALGDFVRSGNTEEVGQVAADIDIYLKTHSDATPDLVSTLTNLRSLLGKAGNFAVLHESM